MRLRAAQIAALAAALGTAGCRAGGGGTVSTAPGGSTTSTALNLAARVQTYPVSSRSHTTEHVAYPQTPPVGGEHAPMWMNCGFYSQPVGTELGVHSMEHGAAWVTYRPNLGKNELDALRELAHSGPYVLVTPWSDSTLPAAVVASAWGVQLRADSARDPGVAAFVQMYANGPQTPEKGAPCSGGFGTPQ